MYTHTHTVKPLYRITQNTEKIRYFCFRLYEIPMYIGNRSICRGGRYGKFYCIHTYTYTRTFPCVCVGSKLAVSRF